MKIAKVEAFPVSYREPTDHNRFRSVCLVKITDSDGAFGWGEGCAYFPEATRAAQKLIEGFAPLVVGESPLHIERIWLKLKEHSWWYGTGAGIASIAISAIDIALWDLKGKRLNASVLDLLGGPVRDRLPAIASLHGTKADIGAMADEIAGHTQTGLHGAKVGFGKAGDARLGFDEARDLEFVDAVMAAMGPGKDLMVDLGVRNVWDVPTAIRRAKAFEERGVAWLEEPLGHDDPKGYAALRAATGIRIAYGEREWNADGVKRIVDSGTVDVVGLDPGRVEGITGFRKAAEICALSRRQANAHNFSTAIVGAASQALSFACKACALLELQPVYGPAQKDLVDRPIWHTNGDVHLPDGPGLGIVIDEDMVLSALMDT
ncbi:MAG: mandelate racemase/muconate lactonizing enzyme family protein [Roseitalea sp.]|jgi:L-alanine-DL-glutamate epimerase-like enolase superfamily enzyme|nr:mandelate racemase/muconate lactonizing enzyme family protein [Roseitalea sp.]MBO6721385.1 mandelate racemase/muconate lactonizing enzyme family protein [Roseitalea sp.]MBO6744570.1 mandelate racemase/muconate lactonizing enzyme family protein [Roseitalea sp.]